jgi:predicted nucleic acid-binding protein
MHFVDTNILVYGFDDSDAAKRDRAQSVMRRLWETRTGRLSHQVLQEFYVTATRKLRPSVPRQRAQDEIESLLLWKPAQPSGSILKQAWQIEDRHGLSWWDSLIVAAAIAQDCTTLLTEDLQHDLQIDKLRVVNPFLPGFEMDELAAPPRN